MPSLVSAGGSLLAGEPRHALRAHPLVAQPRLTRSFRAQLVHWLRELAARFCLRRATAGLAVALLDRWAAAAPPAGSTWALQLHALACLMLAAKQEEVYPPSTRDYLRELQGHGTREALLGAEAAVVGALGWGCRPPTPHDWLALLCAGVGVLAQAVVEGGGESEGVAAAPTVDGAVSAAARAAVGATAHLLGEPGRAKEGSSPGGSEGWAAAQVVAPCRAVALPAATVAALAALGGAHAGAGAGRSAAPRAAHAGGPTNVDISGLFLDGGEGGGGGCDDGAPAAAPPRAAHLDAVTPHFPAALYASATGVLELAAMHPHSVAPPPGVLAGAALLEAVTGAPGWGAGNGGDGRGSGGPAAGVDPALAPAVEVVLRVLLLRTAPAVVAAAAAADGGRPAGLGSSVAAQAPAASGSPLARTAAAVLSSGAPVSDASAPAANAAVTVGACWAPLWEEETEAGDAGGPSGEPASADAAATACDARLDSLRSAQRWLSYLTGSGWRRREAGGSGGGGGASAAASEPAPLGDSGVPAARRRPALQGPPSPPPALPLDAAVDAAILADAQRMEQLVDEALQGALGALDELLAPRSSGDGSDTDAGAPAAIRDALLRALRAQPAAAPPRWAWGGPPQLSSEDAEALAAHLADASPDDVVWAQPPSVEAGGSGGGGGAGGGPPPSPGGLAHVLGSLRFETALHTHRSGALVAAARQLAADAAELGWPALPLPPPGLGDVANPALLAAEGGGSGGWGEGGPAGGGEQEAPLADGGVALLPVGVPRLAALLGEEAGDVVPGGAPGGVNVTVVGLAPATPPPRRGGARGRADSTPAPGDTPATVGAGDYDSRSHSAGGSPLPPAPTAHDADPASSASTTSSSSVRSSAYSSTGGGGWGRDASSRGGAPSSGSASWRGGSDHGGDGPAWTSSSRSRSSGGGVVSSGGGAPHSYRTGASSLSSRSGGGALQRGSDPLRRVNAALAGALPSSGLAGRRVGALGGGLGVAQLQGAGPARPASVQPAAASGGGGGASGGAAPSIPTGGAVTGSSRAQRLASAALAVAVAGKRGRADTSAVASAAGAGAQGGAGALGASHAPAAKRPRVSGGGGAIDGALLEGARDTR